MWYHTKVTRLLGIDYPLFQGPFGGNFSTPALTAAVSNAGGVGGFGAYTLDPGEIYDAVKLINGLTNKPYNINCISCGTDSCGINCALANASSNSVFKSFSLILYAFLLIMVLFPIALSPNFTLISVPNGK